MFDSEIIYCSRCGSPMNKNARYCMKCGNLNYDHPDNKAMRTYAPKEKQKYEIGSGKITNNIPVKPNLVANATDAGNKNSFLLVNILWILLTYGLNFYLGFSNILTFDIVFINSFIISIINIYILSFEIINMKANKPWWGAITPIYNIIILTQITFSKTIYVIFFFIPIVNIIFIIIAFYQLGKKFNKNPFLTMILNIFMIPIIAFGTSLYNGINYTDIKDKYSVEKNFRMRKNLLFTNLIFLIIGIIGLAYTNITSLESILSKADDKILTENAKTVIRKVKRKISKGSFECPEGTSLKPNTTHYFVFDDLRDEFNIYNLNDRVTVAYVKVFNNNGQIEYSISITDGEMGFFEVREEDISLDKITNYTELTNVDNNYKCYLE